MRHIILAATIALFSMSAFAGETAWQEVSPGVTLRLISTGQVKPDGTTWLGLEINMPQSTKTYWRVPGETGLPTQLDFGASGDVVEHEIVWPYPTLDKTADYIDYVYFGPVVLPIKATLAPGADQVDVSAVLGLCSDICVPAQASFTLPLSDDEPDRANGLRIRQAIAMAPMPWKSDPQPVAEVEYDADAQFLKVHLDGQDIDPASIIAATESGEPLFGTPQKSPEPDLVLIPVLGRSDTIDLKNREVQLTFMTGMGAFEVTRPVRALTRQ